MTSQWSCYIITVMIHPDSCLSCSDTKLMRPNITRVQWVNPLGICPQLLPSSLWLMFMIHDSSHLQNTHCIGPKKKQFHTSTMILGGWKQLQWDELGFITCSKPWYLLVPWPGTPVTTCILISANIENHTKWWPLAIMKLVLITPSNSSYMML